MSVKGIFLHKSFVKQYSRQSIKVKNKFIIKKDILILDQNHTLLNKHRLSGKWLNHFSINITSDIRAIYRIENDFAVFVAIGSHSELYGK
jgi:mRNA-degrading endonuclease YafQ of YafQ-DinJ toxin-antitoxin module